MTAAEHSQKTGFWLKDPGEATVLQGKAHLLAVCMFCLHCHLFNQITHCSIIFPLGGQPFPGSLKTCGN